MSIYCIEEHEVLLTLTDPFPLLHIWVAHMVENMLMRFQKQSSTP
jgi:hypothetical protein